MALLDEAHSVFGRLELPACNAIVDGLVKAHRFAHVWELFDQMLGRGTVPSVVTYSTLINVGRHQGNVAKASRGMCLDEFTCTVVIRGVCDGGRVQVATRFLQVMWQSGIALNAAAYTALIDEYCKNDRHSKKGKVEIEMVIYTEMVAKGVEHNAVTYTALIHGHAKHGDINVAFWLQKDMEEKGMSPNTISV
ncbi:hypothetical protein ABZP36_034440 [Zizania latifolia]